MARIDHRILICRSTSATVIVISIGLAVAGLAFAGAVLASTTSRWKVQPSPNHGRNSELCDVAASSRINAWAVDVNAKKFDNATERWNDRG